MFTWLSSNCRLKRKSKNSERTTKRFSDILLNLVHPKHKWRCFRFSFRIISLRIAKRPRVSGYCKIYVVSSVQNTLSILEMVSNSSEKFSLSNNLKVIALYTKLHFYAQLCPRTAGGAARHCCLHFFCCFSHS